jgi:hypothetical protein
MPRRGGISEAFRFENWKEVTPGHSKTGLVQLFSLLLVIRCD